MNPQTADQHPPLRVTILGSGTSTGVPTLGCHCEVCSSTDPRDKRLRASILLTRRDTGAHIVVDTTPDFRTQMLNAKVDRLEEVIYTHLHADHCHGFDDLRAYYFWQKKPVRCYIRQDLSGVLETKFDYAFIDTGYLGTPPQVELNIFEQEPFTVAGLSIQPVSLPHGSETTSAFRFGSFAYATDFKTFTPEAIAAWKGKVHTMVASAVRFRPHPTHSHIDATLALFDELGVKRGYITHISHEIGHERDAGKLPAHVSFAYDGLSFDIG